jgi:hypothetical protein
LYNAGANNIGLALNGVEYWDYATTTTLCNTTLDIGASGAYYELAANDNAYQLYAEASANTGGSYDDGASLVVRCDSGDGTGGVRALQVNASTIASGNLGELYGASVYCIQGDGSVVSANAYNMFMTQINETGAAHAPTGMIAGVMGIYDTTGVEPNATIEGAVVGVLKDSPNTTGSCIIAYTEGDTGVANSPLAYFKVENGRSTAGDVPIYGLDLNDAGSLVSEVTTSDIRLINEETIDNLTNGTVNVTGDLLVTGTEVNHMHVTTDGNTTPDVAGCNILNIPLNTNPTAITDLTNPVLYATYTIVTTSATNPSSIADAGAIFLLTGAWAPNSVGDNITVMCTQVAGAHIFIEIARSDT